MSTSEPGPSPAAGTASRAGGRRPVRRSSLALWGLAAVVAAALLVGAVVGALRGPADLDPASPEGVVQAYLAEVLGGDYRDAMQYLSEDVAQRCGVRAFDDAWIPEGLTATLEDVRLLGDEAEVQVRLRQVSGPAPFGGSFHTSERFLLVPRDGRWRLAEQPWPLSWCPERTT